MRVVFAISLSVSLMAAALPTSLSAHQGATGIVKERMDQMDVMKKSMRVMAAMFRGKIDYNADTIRKHSRIIARHSASTMTDLFPEGSLQHASQAKPVIWEKWDKFKYMSAELEHISNALAEHADIREADAKPEKASMTVSMSMTETPAMEDSADSLFRQLADTCSSCHTSFRKKQK